MIHWMASAIILNKKGAERRPNGGGTCPSANPPNEPDRGEQHFKNLL